MAAAGTRRPTDVPVHPFDEAIELEPTELAGRLRGRTRPDWANMVGPFGGMTAAVLLRAVEVQPERIGEPLALTVNFAAPVADGPFDIAVKAVRTNRTNQHWLVELWQDGAVKTNATAVFGLRRDTWSDTERAVPPVPAPADVAESGLPDMIVWARNYEMRYVEGGVPGPGAQPEPSSVTTLWARDRRGRALDFPSLTAMSDIFYPRVFLRQGAMSPAGTISLTTYFHADAQALHAAGGDFVLARAEANRFSRGYFDQSAELWSAAGELLVTTHQLVYFKA
ncbi:acyl-CoA thioesterase [Mycolicibacterium litorale]|nr:thioesterase family protein [Mycolicibacterium litorale]MCV7414148.1 thioesterase family protein [Mycolicibacterium litorale]TDY02160.1 acyl-CoA thioesterase [Mycolicibacterium litorale]